jgi:hypothetical protein
MDSFEPDTSVYETIQFGDGSMVAIEGRGIVLFKRKNDEYQVLVGIYCIPRLAANFISLGKLDKDNHNSQGPNQERHS